MFAGILGAVNLGGALYLGNVLRTFAAAGATSLPGVLGLSSALYGPLLTYAIGFNLIPALRSAWNKEKNREIRERNSAREKWAGVVNRAVGPLYEKMLSARRYRSNLKVLREEDVSFTTAKSVVEQGQRQQMDDFDARLRE